MWRLLLGASAAVLGAVSGGAVAAMLVRPADGLAGGAAVLNGVLLGLVVLPLAALGAVRGAPPSRVRTLAAVAMGLTIPVVVWFGTRL